MNEWVDCNSEPQSAVVMSTTFYPTKTAPTIYDCMFLILNKVYFNMVLYLYLHFAYVAMTCIQTLKFMYEIQVLHGSADTCCGLLGYDTIQPGTWISTSSQRNTQFQCSGQKCFLKTHYSENISKHSHLRSVAFLCQITTVRSLQCGIKFTIWSTLLPQYGTDSEQFRQHIKKS